MQVPALQTPDDKSKLLDLVHAAKAEYANMFVASALPGGLIKIVILENNIQTNTAHTRMAFVTDPNNISSLIQLLNQALQNLYNLQKNMGQQPINLDEKSVEKPPEPSQ